MLRKRLIDDSFIVRNECREISVDIIGKIMSFLNVHMQILILTMKRVDEQMLQNQISVKVLRASYNPRSSLLHFTRFA